MGVGVGVKLASSSESEGAAHSHLHSNKIRTNAGTIGNRDSRAFPTSDHDEEGKTLASYSCHAFCHVDDRMSMLRGNTSTLFFDG